MTHFELEKEEQEKQNRIQSILFNECNSMNQLRQSLMPTNPTSTPENQSNETGTKSPVPARRKVQAASRRLRSKSLTESMEMKVGLESSPLKKMENLSIQELSPLKKKYVSLNRLTLIYSLTM